MRINLKEYDVSGRRGNKGRRIYQMLFPWFFPSSKSLADCGVAPVPCYSEDGRHSIFWFGPTQTLKNRQKNWSSVPLAYHRESIVEQELDEHIDQIRILLNRQLPYVVDTIPNLRKDFAFVWADSLLNNTPRKPQTRISGRSPSLSVFLAAISWLLQKPLPIHMICSADIDASGNLLPVGRLEDKIEAITSLAPQLNTLVVAEGQEVPESSLKIICFKSIQQLFQSDEIKIEGKTLCEHWSRLFLHKEAIPKLIRSVIFGRSLFHDWKVIQKTTKEMLDNETDEERKEACQFLVHVASRYSEQTFHPFSIRWVLKQPKGHRYNLLCHVEQAKVADITEKYTEEKRFEKCQGHEEYEAQLQRILLRPEAESEILESPPMLKLWGAHGRSLIAQSMTHDDAETQRALLLRAQRWTWGAIHGWINLFMHHEVSLPLCALFRIAASLRAVDEPRAKDIYEQAEALLMDVESFLDDASLMYVQLARGEAAIWFEEEGLGEELLKRVLEQNGWHRHPHVRDASVRALLLLSDPSKRPTPDQIMESKTDWWHDVIVNKTEERARTALRKTYPKIRCSVDFFLRAFP